MGILNVTPDSFSDGGLFLDADAAVDQALQLEAEGADLLDVGGESTRPNAVPVPEEEELRRVAPVLKKLAGRLKVPVSIDTMKPAVARVALDLGASLVNDVAASRMTDEMWRLVAHSGAGYVVMHTQGTPQTMQVHPQYDDVAREVGEFFRERLDRLSSLGVRAEQVILDVGIGFGKTVAHNLRLLAALGEFRTFQRPLLVGASRKSFLSAVAGGGVRERLPGSLAAACWAAQAGAQIVRVHDVAATRQALAVTAAIQAHRTE
ncbi:MAG: dihydropteroate synthase [Verrucomicrobia bacterium]|nr:dihydropteroate synthase [Verrucomicrobiota bacterium]